MLKVYKLRCPSLNDSWTFFFSQNALLAYLLVLLTAWDVR